MGAVRTQRPVAHHGKTVWCFAYQGLVLRYSDFSVAKSFVREYPVHWVEM